MNRFSKQVCYPIITILFLLLVGCSSTTPKSKNTKPYYPLEKGIELLAKNINAFLEESAQKGSMPEILDIAILPIEEKTTQKRLQFSSFITSKISNLMSDNVGEKNNSIMLIEPEKISSEIDKQLQNGSGAQNPNLFKLSVSLNSNLMIKGTFFGGDLVVRLIVAESVFKPNSQDLAIRIEGVAIAIQSRRPDFGPKAREVVTL